MSDYLVEISGSTSLAQISLQVQGEEAGASEFKSSSVSFHGGRITNLATFSELDPGTVPKPITFLAHDAPLPTGAKIVWAGVMVVAGNTSALKASRR